MYATMHKWRSDDSFTESLLSLYLKNLALLSRISYQVHSPPQLCHHPELPTSPVNFSLRVMGRAVQIKVTIRSDVTPGCLVIHIRTKR